MSLASDFGLLFILEARDRASETFAKVDKALGHFSETAKGAADTAKGAGTAIDESLASTASGADALDLAAARTATAQEQLAAATERQAAAEQALLAARGAAASEQELADAAAEVTAAQQRAADAGREVASAASGQSAALAAVAAEMGDGTAAAGLYADAQGRLRNSAGQFVSAADAQKAALDVLAGMEEGTSSAAADALAAATARLADAQRAAAGAAGDLSAAQSRQAAMASSDDIAAAASTLAKAEKDAKAASDALTAAQSRQADVQKAVALSDKDAAAAAAEQAAAQEKAAADTKTAQAAIGKATKIAGLFTLGMAAAGYETTKMAGNFQDATTHLVTDAGESQQNLGMVQAGILSVSTATGTSASAITDAMYHIESAGIHAQSGLAVLKVAAEGARVGGADLDTVSKTLVGTLTAYGMRSKDAAVQTRLATSMMNQLVATVGSGDMRMQDLASSLSSVAPLAASVHLQFAQVGGAIATMTAQGMSADQATQDLANTIRSLSNPNNVAIAEMNQMGVNAQDVQQHLGQRGLTGTIGLLTKAITDHMGKSGQVLMSAFNQSTTAGQALKTMLGTMPAQFRSMAQGLMSGSVSAKQWRTELQAQTPVNQHLMTQFATLYEKSHSFNSLLAAGGPAAQTYTAALAKMMGGATGLNTALMLTGKNSGLFAGNVATIAGAAKKSSTQVTGWTAIQSTFNFKMAQAKTALQNTAIAIGSALLPAATRLLQGITRVVTPIAEWTGKHRTLTLVIFGTVAAIAATITVLGAAHKAYTTVKSAVEDVQSVMRGLGLLAKKTGDEQAASAKTAAKAQATAAEEGATAQETAAAEGAAAQETAAAESAAASEEAAAESSSSWIASMGEQAAAAAQWVAQGAAKVAMYVAENVAGAATMAGAWIAQQARSVAAGAMWVAQGIAKVAVLVAANVAGAASTAIAWMAANAVMTLGIGLAIAAVVAAVVLIITHWKQVSAAVAEVWHDVLHFITTVIDGIVSFVKAHWPLILAVITSGLSLAVTAVVSHWNQIRKWFSTAISDIVSFVRSHWPLILGIVTGGLGLVVGTVIQHWDTIRHWFSEGVSTVLSILRGLAGDVVSIGRNVVIGLWNGISSMGGWLWSQVSGFAHNVISTMMSAFGLGSPSRITRQHGVWLGMGLGNGLLASLPQVLSAARKVSTAVLSATSGLGPSGRAAGASLGASSAALAAIPAGSAGGGVVINLNVTGNTVMSTRDIDVLVDKVGKRLATVTLPAAGRKVAFPRG